MSFSRSQVDLVDREAVDVPGFRAEGGEQVVGGGRRQAEFERQAVFEFPGGPGSARGRFPWRPSSTACARRRTREARFVGGQEQVLRVWAGAAHRTSGGSRVIRKRDAIGHVEGVHPVVLGRRVRRVRTVGRSPGQMDPLDPFSSGVSRDARTSAGKAPVSVPPP